MSPVLEEMRPARPLFELSRNLMGTGRAVSKVDESSSAGTTEHRCKECDVWSGRSVDEYGACAYKLVAKKHRFATLGAHGCDELAELERRARVKGLVGEMINESRMGINDDVSRSR